MNTTTNSSSDRSITNPATDAAAINNVATDNRAGPAASGPGTVARRRQIVADREHYRRWSYWHPRTRVPL